MASALRLFPSALVFSAASVSVLHHKRVALCNAWPFDTQGYPASLSSTVPNAQNSTLYLVGTGMRRRRVIIDFDVYQIGVSMSTYALTQAKQWQSAQAIVKATASGDKGSAVASAGPLSSFVLQKEPTLANKVQLSLVLRMKRHVSRDTFLDAFRVAFTGVTPASFDKFNEIIAKALGDAGVAPNEEIGFYFLNNGELAFARNGEFVGSLNISEVTTRLLDVYTDPQRSVSPELCQSLEQHVASVCEHLFSAK